MAENLILFGFSGFDSSRVTNLVTWAKDLPDCQVILMEDGVLGTAKPLTTEGTSTPYASLLEKNIPVHVVQEDFLARGYDINTLHEGITPITYATLIDTIESAKRVMSWL